ncbi:ROK family protein [Streptomyces coffeae]|uniref:ROK family protein n=1 Tax=Streptomyces coffeae TaxID=621382 RepID=UPI0027DE8412|nr:ROK family protein [Streptomyces coffeae]
MTVADEQPGSAAHVRISDSGAVALAADLGSHHARTGAVGLTEPADRRRAAGRTVRAVGVGFPGPVDTGTGQVIAPSRMPGRHLYELRDRLSRRLELPVLVDNDANMMALGEHRAARCGLRHLVVVKAGRGIGSGVISDGRLYRGARGSAGDISHVRVDAAERRRGGTSARCCPSSSTPSTPRRWSSAEPSPRPNRWSRRSAECCTSAVCRWPRAS